MNNVNNKSRQNQKVTKELSNLQQRILNLGYGKKDPQLVIAMANLLKIYNYLILRFPEHCSMSEIRRNVKLYLDKYGRVSDKNMGEKVFYKHMKLLSLNFKEIRQDENKKYYIQRYNIKEDKKFLFFSPFAEKFILNWFCPDNPSGLLPKLKALYYFIRSKQYIDRKCQIIIKSDFIICKTLSIYYNQGPGTIPLMSWNPSHSFNRSFYKELKKKQKDIDSRIKFPGFFWGIPLIYSPVSDEEFSFMIKLIKVAIDLQEGKNPSPDDLDINQKIKPSFFLRLHRDPKNKMVNGIPLYILDDKIPFFPPFIT